MNEFENDISFQEDKHSLAKTLTSLDVSPIKMHSLPRCSRLQHGKRKAQQVNEAISKKMATVLSIEHEAIECNSGDDGESGDLKEKASDLDHLVGLIKEKLRVSSRREKMQLLTLTPDSWTLRKASHEFHVSKSTIEKAMKVREEIGILGMPEKTCGKKMKEEVVNSVQLFYCSDDNSRQLPGKKTLLA